MLPQEAGFESWAEGAGGKGWRRGNVSFSDSALFSHTFTENTHTHGEKFWGEVHALQEAARK